MEDCSDLKLRDNFSQRPIYVTRSNMIILEAFSPLYAQTYDFLVAIAEPESRPEFIHRYRLTQNSLYAAVAVGIDTETIIQVLDNLCKTELPVEVVKFIRDCTRTFGQAKLVLKDNKYFVESTNADVLRELLRYEVMANARISDNESEANENQKSGAFIQSTISDNIVVSDKLLDVAPAAVSNERSFESDDDVDLEDPFITESAGEAAGEDVEFEDLLKNRGKKRKLTHQVVVSFGVKQDSVQEVKKCALLAKFPLLEEYDFRADRKNPIITDLNLKPSTKIRLYQEKSLSMLFGNGRARSGLIVLPCGAGKSLTGVTAATTIKKSCIIMCINNASVKQWKEQFLLWTTVAERRIKLFTSEYKDLLPESIAGGDGKEAIIVISTYSMLCHGGRRSESSELIMKEIANREWGLIILDEVHVAPAKMFRKVLNLVNAHCKLGLTATLVREDGLIQDLNFLVGPKLYEANWMDLTQQGYLAHVQCVEVWCPMTKEFYNEYLRRSWGGQKEDGFGFGGSQSRVQQLLYILNPRKFRAAEYLMTYHAKRGDKIILFSDDVPALILYCESLQIPYIYGETPDDERAMNLLAFRTHASFNCIGLSKVGDTALDIPEANVIIQVSSHFGARRQEAQRLGRILRPKPNPTGGFNAFFYTLVSTDTREMFYSNKRQQYLADQGYTFKIVQDLVNISDKNSTLLKTVRQEVDLLQKVLKFKNCKQIDDREEDFVVRNTFGSADEDVEEGFVAKSASLSKLTGGE